MRKRNSRLRPFPLLAACLAALIAALGIAWPATASAAQTCGSSNGVALCMSVPTTILTGDVPVSVTTTGSLTGVTELLFSWSPTLAGSDPLLGDSEAPYGFTWRTDRYLDATQYLIVRVQKNNATLGAPLALQLMTSNGNAASVPQNPSDWAQLFHPRPASGDPVIAAVGDGADGSSMGNASAASILGSEASMLLYLGDVYEQGTPAEFDFNYGRASWESGGGSRWGALASFTVPTIGNHEAKAPSGWTDYWHYRPLWATFVFGGIRFIDLDSECALVGCSATSAQYRFVQDVLTINLYPCVVAMWHRPVLSSLEDASKMAPIWALLANNGGDLVLNGHTHTNQRYLPMDANLRVGMPGSHMVEVVAGSGGHSLSAVSDTDSRNAWQLKKTPAVAYVTAVGGRTGRATQIGWQFRSPIGDVLAGSTGSVDCGVPVDTTPPTPPGKPTGAGASPTSIALSWAASSDPSVPITYRIYRDGDLTPVGSTTGTTFTDVALPTSSTHTYAIDAVDASLNVSTLSDVSDAIDVLPPDTTPPTPPGKPTGAGASPTSIALSWAASSDPSVPITYRIYRDGDLTPVGSTTGTTFTDVALPTSSTHTYAIDAVDASLNVSTLSDVSDAIDVLPPDTTPPTPPGKPTGAGASPTSIALSWAASSDPSVPITYRIYRDGDLTPVGSTTGTTFTDVALPTSSTHTYAIDAVDASLNVSTLSDVSDPIDVLPPAIFADDFSIGTFANWTSVTRLTIDGTQGSAAPPSARAQVSSQSASAFKQLSASYPSACLSSRIQVSSPATTTLSLLRVLSTSGGAIARVLVNPTGILYARSDVSGVQRSSAVALGSGWHTIELCVTIGTNGTIDLYRDGVRIVTGFLANVGSASIGRVLIGDTGAKTFTVNFDDVVVDQLPG